MSDWIVLTAIYFIVFLLFFFFSKGLTRIINLTLFFSYTGYNFHELIYSVGNGNSLAVVFYAFLCPLTHLVVYFSFKYLIFNILKLGKPGR